MMIKYTHILHGRERCKATIFAGSIIDNLSQLKNNFFAESRKPKNVVMYSQADQQPEG